MQSERQNTYACHMNANFEALRIMIPILSFSRTISSTCKTWLAANSTAINAGISVTVDSITCFNRPLRSRYSGW